MSCRLTSGAKAPRRDRTGSHKCSHGRPWRSGRQTNVHAPPAHKRGGRRGEGYSVARVGEESDSAQDPFGGRVGRAARRWRVSAGDVAGRKGGVGWAFDRQRGEEGRGGVGFRPSAGLNSDILS
jgi:hypothetical protein